jgi:hypothetical protein
MPSLRVGGRSIRSALRSAHTDPVLNFGLLNDYSDGRLAVPDVTRPISISQGRQAAPSPPVAARSRKLISFRMIIETSGLMVE